MALGAVSGFRKLETFCEFLTTRSGRGFWEDATKAMEKTMKSNVKTVLLACSTATMLFAGQAGASVLLSDNFNSETQALNYTGFANWNVTSGSVDLIGTGFFDIYPGNGNYVDLTGSTNAGGTLTSKQDFSLAPGDSLKVQFDLGGRGVNTVTDIMFGNTKLATMDLAINDPLAQHTLSITNTSGATMTGPLAFRSDTGGTKGAILDNVVLTQSAPTPPTSVSEPATTLLLALGLGVLGLKRQRKAHWC